MSWENWRKTLTSLPGTLEKTSRCAATLWRIFPELRTPRRVRGELRSHSGWRFASSRQNRLPSLRAEVVTLTKLVDDLHQLSLSDEGAGLPKTTVDLVPLLEVAGGAFGSALPAGLTLHYALPDSMTVFGDPDRLMQLFNNLLENGLRYTGSVHISAEQRQSLF